MSEASLADADRIPQPMRSKRPSRPTIVAATIVVLVLLGLIVWWIGYRLDNSVTDDAFIESDMVELAPRVEGQIVEMLVKDSQPITRGQPLARIDPLPYQRKLAQAQAALKVAEAEHAIALAAVQRLEVQLPQQSVAAERQLAVAQGMAATHNLAQVRATVDNDVRLAEQGVKTSHASLGFAQATADRWNALVEDRSATPEEHDAKQASLTTATAQHAQAQTRRLAQAHSDAAKVQAAEALQRAQGRRAQVAQAQWVMARQGPLEVAEARRKADAAAQRLEAARGDLALRPYRNPPGASHLRGFEERLRHDRRWSDTERTVALARTPGSTDALVAHGTLAGTQALQYWTPPWHTLKT